MYHAIQWTQAIVYQFSKAYSAALNLKALDDAIIHHININKRRLTWLFKNLLIVAIIKGETEIKVSSGQDKIYVNTVSSTFIIIILYPPTNCSKKQYESSRMKSI